MDHRVVISIVLPVLAFSGFFLWFCRSVISGVYCRLRNASVNEDLRSFWAFATLCAILSRYCCPSRGTQIPEMTVFQYANDLEMGPVVAPPVAPLLAPAGQQTASVMPVKPVEITKGRGWMTMWDWRNFWPFSALRTPAEANTAEPSTASTNTPNEPTPRPSVGERPAPPLQDRVRVTLIPASGNSGSFPIRLVEMRAALEGKPADVEHAIGASTDNGNERQQVGQGGWKRVFGPILRAIGIGALAM